MGARRPVLPVMIVCCVLAGWLVWECVPALAVAPEAPEVSVQSPVAATTTVLHGVLNPNAVGEAGSYEFLYREGDAGCEGGGRAPEPAGLALGLEHEEVSEVLSGLSPGTEYTACLRAENTSQEAMVGPAVTFVTAAASPSVDGESLAKDEATGTTLLTPTSATLQAQINPNNQKTTYFFEYSTQATGEVLEGAVTKLDGSSPLAGEDGDQKASVSTGAVLVPGTVYYYRVVASNGTPPSSRGKVEHFATPEAPVSESAVAQSSTVVSLTGELNPGGATGKVSYTIAYNDNGTCTAGEHVPAVEVTEGKQLHVHVEAQGLTPNDRYTFCLVSTNAYGGEATGSEVSAQTARQAPGISEASVTKLGSENSTVSVQIDPYGLPTTYEVQYGPTTSYGSSTTLLSLGSANAMVGSETELRHLAPATEYHYRIVASNEAGSEHTTDGAFTTPSAPGTGQSSLPDGRVYEMVTPPENDDANVYVPFTFTFTGAVLNQGQAGISTELPFQASSDGNAFTYAGDPTSGGNGNSGPGEGNEYLATRLAGGGWNQTNLQVPGNRSAYYQAFSSDLSVGIVQSGAGESRPEVVDQPLSSEARGENYKVLYTHNASEADYYPLFSKTVPLHRSAGTFGSNGFPNVEDTSKGVLAYVGGSTNMSRLFFEANDAMTENAVDGGVEEDNLYESVGGRLSLVNVLPGGGSEPNARFGSPGGSQSGPDLSHVISADGSRAFWTGLGTGDLYMTENAGSANQRTVQVDKAVGGGGHFWTAIVNGSKVFFTKGDLYEYDVGTGVTTDLTPGVEVQGVIGASEDGGYVYYVDSAYNFSVWHTGSSKLIAKLSSEDGEKALGRALYRQVGGFGDWQLSLGHRTAEVTPDGHSVVFMAFESLTDYPNEGLEEVYVYESETGRLICVSCNRSGEPPEANVFSSRTYFGAGGYFSPSWSTTFIPQWISNDGSRVFFDSSQPLVPQDTNGTVDVYEWERDGSGTCRETTGCVYLLSGGVSSSTSNLAGESSSGNDVFIITRAQLAPEDGNEAYDLYDARVDGVQPASPPACSGTGCQGVPASPPVFATPPSATFDGVGNFPSTVPKPAVKQKTLTRSQKLERALKACESKHAKKRLVCEKTARKRFRTPAKTGQKRAIGVRKGGKS